MTDRTQRTPVEAAGAHREMAADFEALRRTSARDLTPIESFAPAATHRPRSWEEYLMATFGLFTRRPWASTVLAGALAAVALLVVPFSYMRTTGHAVTLTLSGARLDASRVPGIAKGLENALHTGSVMVTADAKDGAMSFVLSSTVPATSRIDAVAAANAFRQELGRLGYQATCEVAPVREKVTGSAYAYVRDQVIQVSLDGKSASQIESEIRDKLAAAGVTNAQVSVSSEETAGKQALKLKVEATKTNDGTPESEPMPQIMLTKGGQPLEGKGLSIRAEKTKSADGVTLTLHVNQDAKTATITIPHVDTLSDAAIKAQVDSQLAAAGITAKVTVTDGHVMVEGLGQ